MKSIEPTDPEKSSYLLEDVRDFWSRNVNAERIYGRQVTEQERGSAAYFADLETQRYRSHRHLLPSITSMAPGSSVLEIGCGIGLDSFTMAKHGLEVTAIDLTEVAVETARTRFEKAGLRAAFQVANAEEIPYMDDTFDYVYSFGVLHHVPDTERALSEVYRVLKPGGETRIMLYHRHSLNELVHRLTKVPFEDKDELCPVVRRYTRSEVRDIFGQFSDVALQLEYAFGEGYGALFRVTPQWVYNWLSRHYGWHIMIRAIK